MSAFQSPVDIANRALQHCGATRIPSFTDDSKNASEVAFVYEKLRQAELRRNVWRHATRLAVLYPISTTTMSLVPAAWDKTVKYFPGDIVSYKDQFWVATYPGSPDDPSNLPGPWDLYFGALTVELYTSDRTYWAGDLVYETPGDGTAKVYLSLCNNNAEDPSVPVLWDATVRYKTGDIITYSSVVYQSLVDNNLNQTPTNGAIWSTTVTGGGGSLQWRLLSASVQALTFQYPLGAGPTEEMGSRNVYRLPSGFLREAPQDPKAGAVSFLGAPTGMMYNDWEYQGNFIVSQYSSPIVYRFVADVQNVSQMDALFCEGLASRVALEICEILTQSDAKLANIGRDYKLFMTEARTVNGIETGPVEPPEDNYITCRM